MAIRPKLPDTVLALSRADRHDLDDDSDQDLADDPLDPEWEQAWSLEIEQRVDDIVAGRVELVDADTVHAELRAELRDASRRTHRHQPDRGR